MLEGNKLSVIRGEHLLVSLMCVDSAYRQSCKSNTTNDVSNMITHILKLLWKMYPPDVSGIIIYTSEGNLVIISLV
jgi:hypothetical protein